MPIYEYACNSCRHHFDLLRSSSEDKELAFCPISNPIVAVEISPVSRAYSDKSFMV